MTSVQCLKLIFMIVLTHLVLILLIPSSLAGLSFSQFISLTAGPVFVICIFTKIWLKIRWLSATFLTGILVSMLLYKFVIWGALLWTEHAGDYHILHLLLREQ